MALRQLHNRIWVARIRCVNCVQKSNFKQNMHRIEPTLLTLGSDSSSIRSFKQYNKEKGRDKTVVLSSLKILTRLVETAMAKDRKR